MSAAELQEAIDSPRLSEVVERFTTLRLLARDRDHVEITHEALLHAWPRLRSWLDDDRAGNITRQEVEQAASEWVGSQRDPDLLYRGFRLEAAKTWRSTSVRATSEATFGVSDTSAAHAARRQRIRQAVLALLVTLTLVAVTGGAVALQQAHIAGEQAYIAREQERLAFTSAISANADRLRNDDISTAAQLDLRGPRNAARRDHVPPPRRIRERHLLSHPLEGHAADVMSVAYSPDGRTLVTGGADQSVRFWTLGGAAGPVLSGMVATARPVLTVAFGSAGNSVVVGESGGGIEVFSLRDRSRIGPVLQAHTGNVMRSPTANEPEFLHQLATTNGYASGVQRRICPSNRQAATLRPREPRYSISILTDSAPLSWRAAQTAPRQPGTCATSMVHTGSPP